MEKFIDGVKALSLNRGTAEAFKNLCQSLEHGDREVMLEVSTGDTKRIIVSVIEGTGAGMTQAPVGKIMPADNPNYADIEALISKGCTAKAYGTEGATVLICVTEKETIKDLSSGYDSSAEEKVAESYVGKDGLEERIAFIEKHGIARGSRLFKFVIGLIAKSDEVIPKPKEYIAPNNVESPIKTMLTHLATGRKPILEGEKSLGKNVAWRCIEWVLNSKIVPLQCHEGLTIADMMGYLSSDLSNKNIMTRERLVAYLEAEKTGTWMEEAIEYKLASDKSKSSDLVFTRGPVTEALERANRGYGTILLLDELNLAYSNTLSGVFNMLLDGSDHIYVTGLGNVNIPKKNLVIGATQNPPAYLGTNQLNEATKSRFTTILMPEVKNISVILKTEAEKWGVSEFILDKLNIVYNKFKEMSLQGEDNITTASLSIRGFESAVALIGLGKPALEAITEAVINNISSEEERETLKNTVTNYCDGKGNFIP